jgi:hypothetical protein
MQLWEFRLLLDTIESEHGEHADVMLLVHYDYEGENQAGESGEWQIDIDGVDVEDAVIGIHGRLS